MVNNARVIVWDGLFGADNLPTVPLNYVPPIPGASFDWVADTLTPGGVANWADQVSGASFIADGKAPQLVVEEGSKLLRFDGASSRMAISTPSVSGSHTIIAVYRFRAPDSNSVVHFGRGGSGAGFVSTNGETMRGGGNGSWAVPNPYIAPDTNWHVAILTVDGAGSAFRHDALETAANITPAQRDGITLGFATGGTGRTAIDYKRIAIVPGGMDSSRRGALSKFLDTVHKVGAQ